ncbi:geranylgeranyl diphosphate synthase type I [Saccharopolyspora erythraea NRRL 2338]|uniref:Family 2 encapsulin nanocompartment cargo protein polyprenyl transferase n=1 Tax=Saccharopolyspora erythraea TaxID=1836 RepID=A0ABP3P442_SACER|nr:polyprenyl synthetase family protein [Saccharopolyspora erythraea]PFG98165.1 geranylgeranyl diphosphate synthase type I [Saccharopolyspora erythraea NRRL 2338]
MFPADAPVVDHLAARRIRDVSEVLTHTRCMVDQPLREAVRLLPDPLRHFAGYHIGWWDENGSTVVNDGGKTIRPALVLLSCEAAGGDPADAVPAAVAVELLHNFSLLHDDVMDGDLTRRHRPTVWSLFGTSNAILAGDAILGLAPRILSATGSEHALTAIDWFGKCVVKLCEGQAADISFSERVDVGIDACVAMARAKTGELLGTSCALGGLFAGADRTQITALREFGSEIGLAFQLVDDLLGIWGDPAVTGKPVRSDLVDRKKSLPVTAALGSGTQAGRRLAELFHQEESDAGLLAELVEEAGGRDWAMQTAEQAFARAKQWLEQAGLDKVAGGELLALAALTCRRNK